MIASVLLPYSSLYSVLSFVGSFIMHYAFGISIFQLINYEVHMFTTYLFKVYDVMLDFNLRLPLAGRLPVTVFIKSCAKLLETGTYLT